MIVELKETEKYLKCNGIKSAHVEAEDILCHVLGCRIVDLYISDFVIDQGQGYDISEFMKRRMNGEPLQYILEKSYFYGLKLKAHKNVFIPRPETEILVDTVINRLQASDLRPQAILDLCTGSGNIAISLTKMHPEYKIFASDISENAVNLATENARLNNVTTYIDFRCGNLFDPWLKETISFDAIVCNPPYIKTKDLKILDLDVKNQPHEALDGGTDGLDFYKKIIAQAPLYLRRKGFIFFEVDPSLVSVISGFLKEDFSNIDVVKDYNAKDRVISARKKWIKY